MAKLNLIKFTLMELHRNTLVDPQSRILQSDSPPLPLPAHLHLPFPNPNLTTFTLTRSSTDVDGSLVEIGNVLNLDERRSLRVPRRRT